MEKDERRRFVGFKDIEVAIPSDKKVKEIWGFRFRKDLDFGSTVSCFTSSLSARDTDREV